MTFTHTAAQYFIYVLTDCVLLFLLLYLGQFIISVFAPVSKQSSSDSEESKPYLRAFWQLFAGIVTVTFLYAQLKSAFPTVLLLSYPVIAFLVFYRVVIEKKNVPFRLKGKEFWNLYPVFHPNGEIIAALKNVFLLWKKSIPICLCISVFYAALLLWNSNTNFFGVPHYDFITYSNISSALNICGRENKDYQMFLFSGYQPEQANSLYHYPEMWFNAMVIFFTGKSAVLTNFFVTYPVLFTALVLGALALYEVHAPVTSLAVALAVLLLNVSGIYFGFYSKAEFMKYFESLCLTNLACSPKYCFAVLIFIASLVSFFKGREIYALLLLLLLPVCNVGHFPGVIGGAILFVTISYFLKSKTFTTKNTVFILGAYFVFALCYFLFIKLFCNTVSNNPSSSNLITDLLHSGNPLLVLKGYCGDIASMLIRTAVLYSPVMIIAGALAFLNRSAISYYTSAHFRWLLLILLILLTGCAAAFFVNNDVPDRTQLFYNNLPLLNITVCVLLAPFVSNIKSLPVTSKLLLVGLTSVILYSLAQTLPYKFSDYNTKKYNEYDGNFMQKVLSEINQKNNQLGVFWTDKGLYKFLPYNPIAYLRPAYFLCLNDKYADLAEMNQPYSFGHPENTAVDSQWLNSTPFILYLHQHHAAFDSTSIAEMQYCFTKDNSIGYAFTDTPSIIPEKIREKITYQLRDKNTGKYFVEFKL